MTAAHDGGRGLGDALAYALTGVSGLVADGVGDDSSLAETADESPVDHGNRVAPDKPGTSEADVAEALRSAGWTPDRVAAHAHAVLDAAGVWPHPVAGDVIARYGAARFYAALTDLRQRLGVWTLATLPPSHRTTFNADELRLLAEVPPHHVR